MDSVSPDSAGAVIEVFRVLEDAEGTVLALRGASELVAVVEETLAARALAVDMV